MIHERFASNKKIEDLHDEHIQKIERSFDGTQKAKLKRLIFKLEVRKMGIGLALTQGLIGKELSITSKQETKVESLLEEFAKEAEKSLIAFEKRAHRNTITQLSPEQAQALEMQLGDDLSLIGGLVEFHFILMTSDDREILIQSLAREANRSFFSFLTSR